MKYGTLSNEVQGRFVVVWEGLLGYLPDQTARRRFELFDRLGARGRALAEWQTDRTASKALWDLAYRQSYPVDLVSTLGERYGKKLWARVVREVLPIGGYQMFEDEDELDDYVRSTPYIVGAVHGYTNRPMMFGGKGYVSAPGQPWRL